MPFILYGLALIPFYVVILPSVNFPVIPEQEAKPIVNGRPLYSYGVSPLKFSDALDRDIKEITRAERLQEAIEKGDETQAHILGREVVKLEAGNELDKRVLQAALERIQ